MYQVCVCVCGSVCDILTTWIRSGWNGVICIKCVFVCVARCVIYLQLGSEAVGTV